MSVSRSSDSLKLSVIVPSYNYEKYISERLRSIFLQEYPIHEVMVIDDASQDESVARIKLASAGCPTKFTLQQRKTNSGNPFSQWLCAVEKCNGDLIWIAEADDLCSSRFASALVPFFDDKEVNLAFCDSAIIDAQGKINQLSYKGYYRAIGAHALTQTFITSGVDFLLDFLSTRNTVMNVSAVIWRRSKIVEVLKSLQEELQQYRLAGDWRIYVEICLAGGKVAYESSILNMHRRHEESVTSSVTACRHLDEVRLVHEAISRRIGDVLQVEMAQYREWLAEQLKENSHVSQI